MYYINSDHIIFWKWNGNFSLHLHNMYACCTFVFILWLKLCIVHISRTKKIHNNLFLLKMTWRISKEKTYLYFPRFAYLKYSPIIYHHLGLFSSNCIGRKTNFLVIYGLMLLNIFGLLCFLVLYLGYWLS